MKYEISKIGENYISKFEYEVINSEAFNLLSTTQGIKSWFPELRFEDSPEGELLIFEMEDFREDMKVLSRTENSISYDWAGATITFKVESNTVNFQELIPVNFSNPYSTAIDDMTGWAIHNERLYEILNDREPVDIPTLKKKWYAIINEKVNLL